MDVLNVSERLALDIFNILTFECTMLLDPYFQNSFSNLQNMYVRIYLHAFVFRSSVVKSLGVAQSVHQLDGGIHRYLEKYPQGLFRGKL